MEQNARNRGTKKEANKRRAVTIRINAEDNVVIAAMNLPPGTRVLNESFVTVEEIPIGHKVATKRIPLGAPVVKYGNVIGYSSKDIMPGEHVHVKNVHVKYMDRVYEFGGDLGRTDLVEEKERKTFEGIARADGKIGTRNYIGILPTVMCSNSVASRIGEHFSGKRLEKYRNIDGVVAFSHQTGCGNHGLGFEFLQRTLAGYIRHPNFGGVLLVGLGCEDNRVDRFLNDMKLEVGERFKTVIIQEAGGSQRSILKGIDAIENMLEFVDEIERTTVPANHIILGCECGGSDAFSGISANPSLGFASDQVIRNGGTSVFSETPEIYGAEHLLIKRAVTQSVGEKIIDAIKWWQRYCEINGVEFNNNPSPGNLDGGITTILEKSLGAITKGGTTNLVEVYGYAEKISKPGLCFMDTTSHDIASVTGKIAGGANVICFTTGRGTPVGGIPVPVIKLSTNTSTYEQQSDDIDLNCGEIIDGKITIDEMGERIFQLILRTASGRKTKSEEYRFGSLEFCPWQIGAVF